MVWHEDYKRWIITRDREVRMIAADFNRFTVEDTIVPELFGADAFISIDDKKRHDALRLVWAEAFRKPQLEALRPAIVSLVDELLAPVSERLKSGASVDFASALCRPLPTMVIALMMGVPRDMLADVVRWSDAMAAGGPAYLEEAARKAAVEQREAAKTALADYLDALLASRRSQPGDDLVSTLAHSEAGRNLPDDHLIQNLRQLLFAGNETTAKWLAHIFVTYAERPDVQRELRDNRALIVQANDEVMRWQGVVGSVVRKVRGGPIEIAGVQLADGDDVTCLLASANRDPKRFDNPDAFDIHRPPSPNLGFGVGLHHCLGINLAKLEAEIAIGRVLDQIPRFTLSGPCQYSTLPLRGPQPVTIALDVA